MKRDLVHAPVLLAGKSEAATKDDLQVALDLLDTLMAHRESCVGKVQKQLGIQHFPLHKMRHFFASYLHNLGYSDKQIQEAGGWRDGSNIMRVVYQHAMDMENAKKKMSDSIISLKEPIT